MELLTEQEQIRIEKLNRIKDLNINPYPYKFIVSTKAKIIKESYSYLDNGQETQDTVSIAGRLMSWRDMGKLIFADLKDDTGTIQIAFSKDKLGGLKYDVLSLLDIGDIIGIKGTIFRSKRGELSIAVSDYELLSKCLAPLPEKWHGLKDIELRYRQRYLDLIMNDNVKETFILRSQIITTIRYFLCSKAFIEVDTPMLHSTPGGALARPFKTYHNTLEMELYLRIAPELYLKRLIIGGFDRVFELNRVFRNEGISTRHNPEFTILELYQAYADYYDMMSLTEELIVYLANTVLGTLNIKYGDIDIDLTPPFKVSTMYNAILEHTGINCEELNSLEQAIKIANELEVPIKQGYEVGDIINAIFEEKVQDKLIKPTFIIDYPIEVSPLAKKKRDNPKLVERFELFILGREIANAFSELNDPIDQEQRFLNQIKQKELGNLEAHEMDKDYINALKYGLPPTGGLGIGIDRLIMLFTNSPSIRDVILFPQLRKI